MKDTKELDELTSDQMADTSTNADHELDQMNEFQGNFKERVTIFLHHPDFPIKSLLCSLALSLLGAVCLILGMVKEVN